MKRFTPLFLFVLCACARMETPLPSCDNIEATRTGNNFHMKVRSSSDRIFICYDHEYCDTVYNAFFGCINTKVDIGQVITVEDDTKICEIIVK